MKRHYFMRWMALLAIFLVSSFTASADYCQTGNLTRTQGDRKLNSFTLSDGTNDCAVTVNQSATSGQPTYFDKTSSVLTTTPGATISFSALNWTGGWMHGFVYIDYDNNGEFNSTLNANGTTTGELVSASLYTSTDIDSNAEDNKSAGYTYTINKNSKMEGVARNAGVTASSMPSFTLPADIAAGTYRLRFKIDWWSAAMPACGNEVEASGGSMVDMTICILDPDAEPEIEACVPVYGGTGTSRTTTGTGGNSSGRYISNLNVSDGVTNIDVDGIANGTNRAVYAGAASKTLVTTAGSPITLSMTGSYNAMNHFVYVDGDKNGFDAGDLVYSTTGGNNSKTHTFNLSQDISAGKHLVRYKLDWASNDPCKFAEGENNNGEVVIDFFIEIENNAVERTVTVASQDETMGTVAIQGTTEKSITTTAAVVIVATPADGYQFAGWYKGTAKVSDNATYTYNGSADANFVAHFSEISYMEMSRTFTKTDASQSNRYLAKVTTTGTSTPTVFEATTEAQLPYTAWTGTANTYTTSGALIDKTANPILVAHGTTSFDMTLLAYTQTINGYPSELNWSQEAHFVDWNKNKVFGDAGEISAKGNTSVGDGNPITTTGLTVTVNIPEGQEPGTYRMRVAFNDPQSTSEAWQNTLFTTGQGKLRNGVAYDFIIEILPAHSQELGNISASHVEGSAIPGQNNVQIASVKVTTSGATDPLTATAVDFGWVGNAPISNIRVVYNTTNTVSNTVLASKDAVSANMHFAINRPLAHGDNYFILIADVADDAQVGSVIKVANPSITIDGNTTSVTMPATQGIEIDDVIDYTQGNALWFNTTNSSTSGVGVWSAFDGDNPDSVWETKSFSIGNGSFGGTIIGGVNKERVVLNEKTLWKGGPGTGASNYWNMNKTVSSSTLSQIRTYLANGNTTSAHSLTSSNYAGNINYNNSSFGAFTTMGQAYVETGISDGSATNYKRILNMDRSMVVVQFDANGSSYQRRYFCSYPDNVMVWRYTSSDAAQNLTFSFATPQTINSVTSPEAGSLLYNGKLSDNNMQWAMKVLVRTNDGGTVTANASARTITVSGSKDVEFILAGDTDYKMNFDPDMTDARAFVGEDPMANVNEFISAAAAKSYNELYATHMEDYSELFDRVEIEINPDEEFQNLPTPTRLQNYRNGTLDHGLEQLYFQYGRYLLISCSRAGNMPANLQGMWSNSINGPWRVDYHNNINLQMNYWPATCTNLLECFTPLIDYVRGLVKPGEKTAQSYYGARGWTAECSTNIFGFTAPLNATDMSWNYNPTAGPWLATQMWEYYDYTRDKEWLREIGYPIIRSSANFVSDLLYDHNGTYTSAPSYSPEHGTCDLGATYANAVTREVLKEAIEAADILGEDATLKAEWQGKLDAMYPYQVGRYGQLQEWYNDIDTYGDTHRHTNHLFGLHPGTSINVLEDQTLADACKETLRQRGDDATGWSMGWKLNHWARLLDGDHAYTLFKNLLKNGTADNMWDLHPPFQIDGNFGGTAGVTELLVQSHNGMIHLLPALPSNWTEGKISGIRTRGNFTVDVYYSNGKLDFANITSNAGEPCKVYYNGLTKEFATSSGSTYTVTYDPVRNELITDQLLDIDMIEEVTNDLIVTPAGINGRYNAVITGGARGSVTISIINTAGQVVKTISANKADDTLNISFTAPAATGIYMLNAKADGFNLTRKFVVK